MRILSWSIEKKDQPVRSAELNGDLTVVLAPDEGAKAAFLGFVGHLLPGTGNGARQPPGPWSGHLVLGTPSGPYKLEPSRLMARGALSRPPAGSTSEMLCIRSTDASELAKLDGRSIAERLLGPCGGEGRKVIESLRAREERLLSQHGQGGRIGELIARLREIEAELVAVEAVDRAAAEEIEAVLADDGAAGLAYQRAALAAERGRLASLLALWPSQRKLTAVLAELESFAPPDRSLAPAESRYDEILEQRATADNHCRILRGRRMQLQHELEGVRTKQSLGAVADEVRQTAAQLAGYRDRLLTLAAARARLADLEGQIAAAPADLGPGWDVSMLARFAPESSAAQELGEWRNRLRSTRASVAAAAGDLAAVHERVDAVCVEVTEELARECPGEEHESDAGWRALWRLRANLEELWLVRSRAESRVRTLQDREAALAAAESATHWAPPARLGDLFSFLAVVAAGLFVARIIGRDFRDAALLAALALGLAFARLAMHGRINWAQRERRRTRSAVQKLRAEVQELREGRDADWKAAARLDEAIRSDGARLGFSGTPAPDAVDACEQELARRVRSREAPTPLGELIRRLLEAQDEEQAHAARRAAAEESEAAVLETWGSWRAAADLPEGADPETVEERLARLRDLSAAMAKRDALRGEMLAMEPDIAAWESGARALLIKVGVEVPPDLCGKALATEITVLGKRVERNAERQRRRAALEEQLARAEAQLAEGDAELERVHAQWNALVASTGAGGDDELEARIAAFRRRREVERRVGDLEGAIERGLANLEDPARARSDLASGAVELWEEELRRIESDLAAIDARLGASEERWHAAAPLLARTRAMADAADLLLRREETMAALVEATREWRRLAIARGLIEDSLAERESARRREILDSASRVLASLSAGAYTAIVPDAKSGALALARDDGSRLAADGKLDGETLRRLALSIRLGHATHLARLGRPIPVILDDVLAPFSPADAAALAKEIAAAAHGNQILYLTTNASIREALARAGGAVGLLEI